MKEGFDKEMDSLLRRRARGTAELRSRGDGPDDGLSGAHLDADEIGAFAEGALPAAARVAAASHLADCDRCRGVVVGVAGAGVEVKDQVVAATSESARPSAWRALVASLFAPRGLRYATPVLALSLVAVVSYIALRSNNRGALPMAREDRQQTGAAMKEPAAPTTATDSAANANASGLVGQNSNAAPREEQGAGASSVPARGHGGAEAQPAEATTAREDAQPPVASPPPPPAAAAEGPAELSKAAPKTATTEEGEGARADNKEKSENRDKSARTSEPADDAASNDTVVQQRRAAQSRANEVQMPDGGARNQKRAADNNASSGYGNVGGAASAAQPKESDRERAGSRSESLSRGRAAKQAEKKDEDEKDSQTRTAAGHRFRREGSAWVDVNYKSSMPSTGVRRGTEGFRALVADVPEVGRVAEAIGGDVTVVVGRRAYRIH